MSYFSAKIMSVVIPRPLRNPHCQLGITVSAIDSFIRFNIISAITLPPTASRLLPQKNDMPIVLFEDDDNVASRNSDGISSIFCSDFDCYFKRTFNRNRVALNEQVRRDSIGPATFVTLGLSNCCLDFFSCRDFWRASLTLDNA